MYRKGGEEEKKRTKGRRERRVRAKGDRGERGLGSSPFQIKWRGFI
jgi:hypothetical protein